MAFNRPWHTEAEFESYTRFLIGSATSDDVTAAIWSQQRDGAETEILSVLQDANRPLRTMLTRVSGELIPQWGKIRSATSNYSHTVSILGLVSTPSASRPLLWKNLSGPWQDRFEVTPLVYGTDWDIVGNSIVITTAEADDKYALEYQHTLAPTPGALKYLSMDLTIRNLIQNKFGTDEGRQEEWAGVYAERVDATLNLMRKNQWDIPEFAAIALYRDWEEGSSGIVSIHLGRV